MCIRDPSFTRRCLECGAISRSLHWLQILVKQTLFKFLKRCHEISWKYRIFFCTLYFQPLQLPPGEWPSQVIFDRRPQYEHIAYTMTSQRTSFFVTSSTYVINGSLCRYNVQDQTILQQLSGVICIQCLRDGEQLLVIQVENINQDDPDKIFQIHSVLVLDSVSFTPLLKFREKPDGEGPLHQMLLCSRTAALYSSDFKTISFFNWDTYWKGQVLEVLILTLGKTCLSLMTLRESCRSIILQHVRTENLVYLPLPESLRNFLHGF